ncbi:MAG: hypothetical protein ACK43M_14615 [Allorhizobium sp.]
MNITNHTESPYFERLPRYAKAALQAAWDKAHGKQFNSLAIYQSFCRDMDVVGYEKPSKQLMYDWISRVQQGHVIRPGSEADGADPALVANLEAVLAEPIEEIVEEPVALDLQGHLTSPKDKGKAEAAHRALHRDNEVLALFATTSEPAPKDEDVLVEVRANLRKELQTVCLDGVDDLTDEVVSRAQKMARQMMIEILRELAAEMEAAA